MNNLTKFPGLFNPQDDGSIQLAFPTPDDTIIPNFAVEQTGGWVEAIFNDSDKYKGEPALCIAGQRQSIDYDDDRQMGRSLWGKSHPEGMGKVYL